MVWLALLDTRLTWRPFPQQVRGAFEGDGPVLVRLDRR